MSMLAPATARIIANARVRFLLESFLDVYAPTCAPIIEPAASVSATGKFMKFDW